MPEYLTRTARLLRTEASPQSPEAAQIEALQTTVKQLQQQLDEALELMSVQANRIAILLQANRELSEKAPRKAR